MKLDIISDFGVYESIENSKYFMHNKLEWNNNTLIFRGKNWVKKYTDCMDKYKLLLTMLNIDLILKKNKKTGYNFSYGQTNRQIN